MSAARRWRPPRSLRGLVHGVREGGHKHLGAVKKYETIRKIIIRPADGMRRSVSIIILDNPADEPAAIAVSDEGAPADKATKGEKSTK